jgi:hypothetical protein
LAFLAFSGPTTRICEGESGPGRRGTVRPPRTGGHATWPSPADGTLAVWASQLADMLDGIGSSAVRTVITARAQGEDFIELLTTMPVSTGPVTVLSSVKNFCNSVRSALAT